MSSTLNIRRLHWLAILAPVGFLGVLEYARYALQPILGSWQGWLLMDAVVLMGALFFYGAVFSVLGQVQSKLERKNRELVALRNAGLDLVSDLSLESVLDKVVEQARNLIGTRYGALSLIDGDGKIQNFVVSGIDGDERGKIGEPPTGKGLLGVVLREGQRLRLDSIGSDARSAGFPEHHPSMRSLLAVPVICRGPFRGNLYLSEKTDSTSFSEDDEETLVRFASQAAIAIDNAHLHRKVRQLAMAEERLRIAHEMHDGQAQVLAYVNAKAQAVQEFLKNGRYDEANTQLDQLAKAAREVLADVREGILGLRSASGAEKGLADVLRRHVEQWQDQSGISVELGIDGEPKLGSDVELQLIRIVQEALSNVRKHSGARQVRLALKGWNGGVHIAVEDDGIGFNPDTLGRSQMPRFGLATMRERCEAIGARLRVESQREVGTRLEVEYPGEHERR
ncbi:MAG: GAF domain-containing sensor histidine kinase [Thermoanaerobaculia bacterium]|nr:GAF domain-containing sensor histidine kinase [Thermoanaerobaculia bacterium]